MSHLRDSPHTLVLNTGQQAAVALDFGPQRLEGTARSSCTAREESCDEPTTTPVAAIR
jgi:hypothetical protein